MTAEFFRTHQLSISFEQFCRLPRNPAYKYEYLEEQAWLSPRPTWYHAELHLESLPLPPILDALELITLRPLQPGDWEAFPRLFAAAFRNVQPFGSLDDGEAREAARRSLERTQLGGDGPLIERACFVAESEQGHLCGALLVTLIPDVDLSDIDSNCFWPAPPSATVLEQRQGMPHLTWIFVSPLQAGHGVGTGLLAASVRELLALQYDRLASTFLLGNESSMLWHWRNGFRLLGHPSSWRELRRRWK